MNLRESECFESSLCSFQSTSNTSCVVQVLTIYATLQEGTWSGYIPACSSIGKETSTSSKKLPWVSPLKAIWMYTYSVGAH